MRPLDASAVRHRLSHQPKNDIDTLTIHALAFIIWHPSTDRLERNKPLARFVLILPSSHAPPPHKPTHLTAVSTLIPTGRKNIVWNQIFGWWYRGCICHWLEENARSLQFRLGTHAYMYITFKFAGTAKPNIKIFFILYSIDSIRTPVTFSEDAQVKKALKLKTQFVGKSILFAYKQEVNRCTGPPDCSNLHHHHNHHHHDQVLETKVTDVRLVASEVKSRPSKIVFDIKPSKGEVQFFLVVPSCRSCSHIRTQSHHAAGTHH